MAKRRNVLMGVGGMIAVAGCSDTSEPEIESDNESEEEEEIQEEESEEEEELELEEEPEEEQEDTESEEEEEENEDRQDAISKIDSAKDILEEGLQIYADFGENGEGILDITSMNEDFRFTNVVNHIRDADEDLEEAEEYSIEDLTEEIDTLRKEYNIIDHIARTQRQGQVTRRDADSYDSSMNGSRTNLISLRGHNESLEEGNDDFEENISDLATMVDNTPEFIIRDKSLYERKVIQFDDEHSVFDSYIDMHSDYERGVETLNDAESAYSSEEYNTAEFRARDAERSFEDCLDRLSEPETDELEDLTDSLKRTINSDIRTARRLQEDAADAEDRS